MLFKYRKGYILELKARDELKKNGYYVIRSSGSHGLFDLVAIKENEILFIQIKRQIKRKKIKEEEEIKNFKIPENCRKEIWIWKPFGKQWEKIPFR
jgi:Holliday junction resolvase